MRNFKFFHGYDNKLTAVWMPETDGRDYYNVDIEQELTRLMSEEIARGIDEEIITRLTRTINGGRNNEIQRNLNYLNHWIGMGGQRA
jgi:hypothetical protein